MFPSIVVHRRFRKSVGGLRKNDDRRWTIDGPKSDDDRVSSVVYRLSSIVYRLIARYFQSDNQTTKRVVGQLEPIFRSVQTLEPRLCIRETNSLHHVTDKGLVFGEPGAIVLDLNAKRSVARRGRDLDPSNT